MKAKVLGAGVIVLGILLILTPWYLFPVCGVGRYAPGPGEPVGYHPCHGTLKAETVLGAVVMAVGLVPLLWPRRRAVLGASAAGIAAGALAILFPLAITGLCQMPTMACQLGTKPALVILGLLLAGVGGVGLGLGRKMP